MPPGTRRRNCSTATRTLGRASASMVGIPVQLLEPGGAPRPGEPLDPGRARGDEPGPLDLVVEAPYERGGETLGVIGFDQQCTVPEHLGQRADTGGHDGYPGPHGLEGREAEALVAGGKGEHARTLEQ